MNNDEHRQIVASYRAMIGKGTPAEYMAYMWSRQALGEPLSAGQRGFLAAAQKPAWHNETAAPATPPPTQSRKMFRHGPPKTSMETSND